MWCHLVTTNRFFTRRMQIDSSGMIPTLNTGHLLVGFCAFIFLSADSSVVTDGCSSTSCFQCSLPCYPPFLWGSMGDDATVLRVKHLP